MQFYLAQRRAYALNQLRTEMRERAVNGPEAEPPPPCTTARNTGEVFCDKQWPLIACETRTFIDPLDVWGGARNRDDLEEIVKDKYDEVEDMRKLAQCFACQGFRVTYLGGALNAVVRTPNGYGFFYNGPFPLPLAWAEGFSSGGRMGPDGRLRMDIGTTVE